MEIDTFEVLKYIATLQYDCIEFTSCGIKAEFP